MRIAAKEPAQNLLNGSSRGYSAKRSMSFAIFTRTSCSVTLFIALCSALIVPDADAWLQAPVSPIKRTSDPNRKVDFATDILPLLKQRCFSCHGPKQQMGQYRLDSKQVALTGGLSGPNLIPGNSKDSPLFQRVAAIGKLNVMPLTGEKLTSDEIALIKSWIDQGAAWPDDIDVGSSVKKHWAYVKPSRAEVPEVKDKALVRNPIDSFVLARLNKEGLTLAEEAPKQTLIRRLSLDLRGLPPTIEEIDRFLNDGSTRAYDALVDRMLASPSFGEHFARYWLDLARYADTNGYESDEPRTMWAYRDWVIDAFNRNLSFDQFTIEQLAGDLLPNARPDQIVATAFHRNTMINNEAGSKDDEFRDAAVKDRVDTTAVVWLGSTLGCAQCHDHKYDPFKQTEYYKLYSIFNNTADSAIKVSDSIEVFKGDVNELQRREAELAAYKKVLDTHTPALAAAQRAWEERIRADLPALEKTWEVLDPVTMRSESGASFEKQPDGTIVVTGKPRSNDAYELEVNAPADKIAALRLESFPDSVDTPSRAVLTDFEAVTWLDRQTQQRSQQLNDLLRWSRWSTIGPFRTGSRSEAYATAFPPETNYDLQAVYESGHLAWIKRTTWKDGRVHYFRYLPDVTEENCASYALRTVESKERTRVAVSLGSLKGLKIWLNKKLVLSTDPTRDVAPDQQFLELDLEAGKNEILIKATNDEGAYGFYFRPYTRLERQARIRFSGASGDQGDWQLTDAGSVLDGKKETGWTDGEKGGSILLQVAEPVRSSASGLLKLRLIADAPEGDSKALRRFRISATSMDKRLLSELRETGRRVRSVLAKTPVERSAEERQQIERHYRSIAPALAGLREQYRTSQAALDAFNKQNSTTVMVMKELLEPRKTFRQNRGSFLDLAEQVDPGVPAILHPIKGEQRLNRLNFARWLMDTNNPLTARVRVNQVWLQIFGKGLVGTSEDFGTQGDAPSHPELLDWLATEFIRLNWDTKALLKAIVTSATYRQSSAVTPEKREKDPDNKLLSRGARYRLAAEIVRDETLAASGLLSPKIGGPSVFPPQPSAVMADHFVEGGFKEWPTSAGADRYRRGLYTFYKRTAVYPMFATFDAPDRTVCVVERPRSNTPLQALDTLNSPVFFEAAGALAKRMLTEVSGDFDARLEHGFRLVVARKPTAAEVRRLSDVYRRMHAKYEGAQSREVVTAAFLNGPPEIGQNDLAAWVLVANVLLNLDETLMRE